jgi:DNA mismatch repair protein PMS2
LTLARWPSVRTLVRATHRFTEIRLKEFGSECIEVSDNGAGIDASQFDAIALKHFTSKIDCFEDLEGAL